MITLLFALVGDAADASLEASTVVADAQGHAEVVLHAPSRDASFRLRVADTASNVIERDVAVSGDGFATLTVHPTYNDTRTFKTWRASAHVGKTCASFADRPYPDAAVLVETTAPTTPVLENIPVGPTIAVVVNSDAAITGCADVPKLSAGADAKVDVSMSNVALVLAGTNLAVDFASPTSVPTGWDAQLDAWQTHFIDAFMGDADSKNADDAGALLDSMYTATDASSQGAFTEARAQNDWNGKLATYFAGNGKGLRSSLTAWVGAARGSALSIPGDTKADLTVPSANDPTTASLSASSIFGIDVASLDGTTPSPRRGR